MEQYDQPCTEQTVSTELKALSQRLPLVMVIGGLHTAVSIVGFSNTTGLRVKVPSLPPVAEADPAGRVAAEGRRLPMSQWGRRCWGRPYDKVRLRTRL